MRYINLSKSEISLLEDICFTKLLTVDSIAIIENDNDINEVIKNITIQLLTLGKNSPYYFDLNNILNKFINLRNSVFKNS